MERDNLAIANLEIRTADLLAAKAELEPEEEKQKIEDEVLHLLLDYEAAQCKLELRDLRAAERSSKDCLSDG